MKKIAKRLPEAEFAVMSVLWEAEPPVSRSYFDAKLAAHNWADSTILSLLARLCEKGFLQVEKQGNRNVYAPLIGKDEYLSFENTSFLRRLHGGSIAKFVAGMAENGSLNEQDVAELERLLAHLKAEDTP